MFWFHGFQFFSGACVNVKIVQFQNWNSCGLVTFRSTHFLILAYPLCLQAYAVENPVHL